jgi:transmembrane sensor
MNDTMREQHSSPATPDMWAFRWVKRLPTAEGNVRAAFVVWMRQAPEHVEAYCRQKVLDVELRALDPERRIDAPAFITRARARLHAKGNVIPWPGAMRDPLHLSRAGWGAPPQPLPLRTRRVGAVALALAMLILMAGPQLALRLTMQEETQGTASGERRSLSLPDGTRVLLNAQSRLQVHFSPQQREVRLLQGEALFTISHEPRRPFHVRIDNILVEDVGTSFDVRREQSGADITVAQGRVIVQTVHQVRRDTGALQGIRAGDSESKTPAHPPITLVQEEEAFVPVNGARPPVRHLSERQLAARTAWKDGLIVLDEMTLAQAIREFNRYNPLQLVLADEQVGSLRLGGEFKLSEPLAFVSSLRQLGCQISTGRGDVQIISQCRT